MKLLKKIILIFIFLFLICKESYLPNKETIHCNNPNIINQTPKIEKIFSKKIVNEDLISKYNLNEIIEEAHVPIPILDNFIPQGITLVKGNYFITGYYDSKIKSKCYILDSLGNIVNIVELDTNSHVGSISYDEKRDLLWIPDNNGILNAYSLLDFFTKKEAYALYKFDYISQGLIDFQNSIKNIIAYLCIDGNDLYIGNFFIDDECTIKKYKIVVENEKLKLEYTNTFKVPKRIQGITFIKHNNKKYMLLSQSYRRRNPSYLYVYEYDENKNRYSNNELKKIKMPPMLEQITVYNNSVYLLFESNAFKYWNCPEKIEFIIAINLLDLLNIN